MTKTTIDLPFSLDDVRTGRARKRKYSYDSNCRDLADHFLAETVCTDADREDLAQDIQDAVESWFREWEWKNVPQAAG